MKDKKIFLFVFILSIAAFLRFYNYQNRFILHQDQAKDVIVARISLREKEIPLLGSISSAGFFFFGPYWYWFLMLPSFLFPRVLIAPWIFFTLTSLILVYLYILIGKKLFDDWFGIILGILTAISFSQVYFSAYLTHHIMVGFFASLSILEVILICQNKDKKINYFLLGLFIGIGINMHWQALNLLVILLPLLLLKPKTIKYYPLIAVGLLITFIPLIIFDLQNKFLNFNNLVYYFYEGKNRFYMPNRWLTYAFVFWPDFFGKVIGVNKIISYILITAIFLLIMVKFINKRISKILLILIISFAIQVVLLRYHPGEKFETYLIYLHPYILIFTGWLFYEMIKFNKWLGLASFVFTTSLIFTKDIFLLRSSNVANQTTKIRETLVRKIPREKFIIYHINGQSQILGFPLGLYLDIDDKLSKDGRPIGICDTFCPGNYPVMLKDNFMGHDFILVDLGKLDRREIQKKQWFAIFPEEFRRPAIKL